MGIYDRDYLRNERAAPRALDPRRGVAVMKMWSVNTWLIVICVAVFVIDGFLPRRDVPTGRVEPGQLAQIREMWEFAPPPPDFVLPPNTYSYWRPIVEKGTNKVIGRGEVYHMRFLESFLHFSTRLGFLQIEYWRFIGFQFVHAQDVTHLLFNMIGLFFFGPLVEQYLGSKRYLAFYLLCGIFGAIMYLLLNLSGYILAEVVQSSVRIPGLLFNDPSTPLVGASAGIFGVLMAGAYLAPNVMVLLFFFLPMRLVTLAYALVAIALFTIVTGGRNAGGEAGHLGGAIAGYYFIRRPHHLHGFFDFLGRVDPTSHHYRHGKRPKYRSVPGRSAEIDRILDKINAEGLHSLTEAEKRALSEASERGI